VHYWFGSSTSCPDLRHICSGRLTGNLGYLDSLVRYLLYHVLSGLNFKADGLSEHDR